MEFPPLVLVTGTDTGVGKTVVCSVLMNSLLSHNFSAVYWKPIETGCKDGESEELKTLKELSPQATGIVTCLYKTPASPLTASIIEGKPVPFEEILSSGKELTRRFQVVIAESAGGLLVPITEKEDYRTLVLRLNGKVLLVVGNRLGCINHARLTYEFILKEGIPFFGWILNQLTPEEKIDFVLDYNLHILKKYMGEPLDVIPFPITPHHTLSTHPHKKV
jgi:dethiobiotin synthetase